MTVQASFFSEPYSAVVYIAGAYLLWTAVAEKGRDHVRWVWRKVRPLEPVAPEEPPVFLSTPSMGTSFTPSHEIPPGEHRRVTKAEPSYPIENKDPLVPISQVTTGVRTRDGRDHIFDYYNALLAPASTERPVTLGQIPLDFLEGVHESEVQREFLYWARFTRQGIRWEAVFDPRSGAMSYSQVPIPKPLLRARVVDHPNHRHDLVIENAGDVTIERVEIELPSSATNWRILTDTLPAWPIRAIEPGESATMPLIVTMGTAAQVEAILRGRAEGVPYHRQQVLAL